MMWISFCHRWLCNESLPPASRRWSVEGLAYLTFDADVKEDLVEDKSALQAMFQLAKVRQWQRFFPSEHCIYVKLFLSFYHNRNPTVLCIQYSYELYIITYTTICIHSQKCTGLMLRHQWYE